MGASDGFEVGVSVGVLVSATGDDVASVGVCDGPSVGMADGSSVGCRLGETDGPVVGMISADGEIVGNNVCSTSVQEPDNQVQK